MANLMLHQGSSFVGKEELRNVFTPPPIHSWQSISHEHLLSTIEHQLGRLNYHVTDESHGLSKNGSRYFGLLEIGEPDCDRDYQTVIGVRNSHDKSFPAGVCVGTCVLVCDNLCFGGEITLARKHTRFILRDLPDLVRDAISGFTQLRVDQHNRIAAYKHKRIHNRSAHDLIIRAIDNKIIPVTKVPGVLSEWREPSHNEFTNHGRSLWRLHNAFSESWKGANLNTLPRRSQRLHQLLDRACGFQLAV